MPHDDFSERRDVPAGAHITKKRDHAYTRVVDAGRTSELTSSAARNSSPSVLLDMVNKSAGGRATAMEIILARSRRSARKV